MIQTKQAISYEMRSNKEGVIFIDIPFFVTTKTGKTFTVNDYVLKEDGTKEIVSAKEVTKTNEELRELEAYLDANNDFSELTPDQEEWAKVQLGLMIDTQTNLIGDKTIYNRDPQDWELTEITNL